MLWAQWHFPFLSKSVQTAYLLKCPLCPAPPSPVCQSSLKKDPSAGPKERLGASVGEGLGTLGVQG